MIINHDNPTYRQLWYGSNQKYNGAYYYSKEITEIMIPLVNTDRNWITINIPGVGVNHSIVFIHNNLDPNRYKWLKAFDDLILICGIPETVNKVKHLGKAIYLPLSVDVKEVEKYRTKKDKDVAYVGRSTKKFGKIPEGVQCLENMPRHVLLREMARYKRVYAVGRTAIEAKVLDCRLLDYDPRFPDVKRWQVLDTRDAAKILQAKIDEIDKG